MLVKVTRQFRDKYSREIYPVGKIIDISEERYNEIIFKDDFVYRLPESHTEGSSNDVESNSDHNENSAETTSNVSGDGFDIMTVRELKEYADVAHKLTFKAGTKKADIISELRRIENGRN